MACRLGARSSIFSEVVAHVVSVVKSSRRFSACKSTFSLCFLMCFGSAEKHTTNYVLSGKSIMVGLVIFPCIRCTERTSHSLHSKHARQVHD